MADGDIKYRFMADAQAAERAIASLEKKYDSLEAKIKNVSRSSKKGSDDGIELFNKLGAAASTAGIGILSIGGALTTVGGAMAAFNRHIDAMAQKAEVAGQNLIAAIAGAGDLAAGPMIQERLGKLPVAREDATKLFAGVSGGGPDVDLARRLDIVGELTALPGVFSEGDTTIAARLAGRLGREIPGRGANDIADLSTSILQQLGGRASAADSPGFQRALALLQQSGMSPERAAAVASSTIIGGGEAGALAALTGKLNGKSLDQFIGNPAAARGAFGAEGASLMALLDPAKITAMEQSFAAAQVNNLAQGVGAQGAAVNLPVFAKRAAAAGQERAADNIAQLESVLQAQGELGRAAAPQNFLFQTLGKMGDTMSRFGTIQKASFSSDTAVAAELQKQTVILQSMLDAAEKRGQIRRDAHAE